jgi:hypothetical protein
MGPISDVVLSSLGDTILVEIGLHSGFELSAKAANDLVIDHTAKKLIPIHSARLETNAIKVLLITLVYKHTMEDAALGFYRSSLHEWVASVSRKIKCHAECYELIFVNLPGISLFFRPSKITSR